MATKQDLQRMVETLSEYECQHLLSAVFRIAEGERFWERDLGLFYNESVKLRSFVAGNGPADATPNDPAVQEPQFVSIPIVKAYAGAPRIRLPSPELIDARFSDVALRRRSERDYTGEAISVGQLSSLLQHAGGMTGVAPGYDYTRLPLRSFPSAGGLQSPELYLASLNVDGVPPGLYHYHPIDHALELVVPGHHGERLSDLTFGQPWVATAGLVCMITGYYERLRWKYGERAYRYLCMDAGFLGENVCLAAEALGLGACAIAGFVDGGLEQLLGIDGQDEVALLLMTVGTRDNRR